MVTSFLPNRVGWDNWSALFLDVDLWRPVVERICAATAVGAAEHIIAGFPGSCAVFIVDGRIVVKLFPPMLAQDFHREQAVYGLLDGRLPHLPRLLGAGIYQDQLEWPYLLVEFCQGVAIRELFAEMEMANRLRVAKELGQMLRVVHDTAVGPAGPLAAAAADWAAFIAGRKAQAVAELRQKNILPEGVLAELAHFIEQVELGDERPILIHADLTEDHLLLTKQDGQWHISALIDWADAEMGAVEYEWMAFWFELCQRNGAMFRQLLLAYDPTWQLDEQFAERLLAYTVLHRFGAGMIEGVLRENGRLPIPIHSLAELQALLWGNLLRN